MSQNEESWTPRDQREWDLGVNEFFDRLDKEIEAGRMTPGEVIDNFIPEEVKTRCAALARKEQAQ